MMYFGDKLPECREIIHTEPIEINAISRTAWTDVYTQEDNADACAVYQHAVANDPVHLQKEITLGTIRPITVYNTDLINISARAFLATSGIKFQLHLLSTNTYITHELVDHLII